MLMGRSLNRSRSSNILGASLPKMMMTCAQIRKACAIWARVRQVLRSENFSPHVAATFYKAVVQAFLLYGSKTWVLSQTALARFEGFHICAAYRMAKMHKLKQGLGRTWIYPWLKDVLQECALKTMEEYIGIRWQTIAVYVVTRPILNQCRQGKQKRGAVPCLWWWEQPMDLDIKDTFG
jgi:hypothetical protein